MCQSIMIEDLLEKFNIQVEEKNLLSLYEALCRNVSVTEVLGVILVDHRTLIYIIMKLM